MNIEIRIDYLLWDLEETKIKFSRTIKINESDILELMKKKYDDDELPIPINYSKSTVKPKFHISGATF